MLSLETTAGAECPSRKRREESRARLTARVVGAKGVLSQRRANLDVVFGIEPIASCHLRLAVLGMLTPRMKGLVRLELDDRDPLAIISLECLVRDKPGNRPRELKHAWNELAELFRRLWAKTRSEDDDRHLLTLHRPAPLRECSATRLFGLLLGWPEAQAEAVRRRSWAYVAG